MKFLLALLLLPSLALAQFVPSIGSQPPSNPDYTMPAGKIYIDTTSIPKARLGLAVEKLSITCTGTYAACRTLGGGGSLVPNPSSIYPGNTGSFRITCKVSHFSFDDPIVWPGRPGQTHLHMFFGNDTTFANSTLDTMDATGNSNCPGGILNRTGYWTPALIYHRPGNSRDGEVEMPNGANFYYKDGQDQGISPTTIHNGYLTGGSCPVANCGLQWAPRGLRMIAGNASNTGADTSIAAFVCLAANGTQFGPNWRHIPTTAEVTSATSGTLSNCSDFVWNVILFPMCWNGTDLYLPGSAHMAYATANQGCTSTSFPIMLPQLSYTIHFPVANLADFDYWRLSSDQPKATASGACASITYNWCAGATLHGDWVNGWSRNTSFLPGFVGTVTDAILKMCIRVGTTTNAGADCHDNLLGAPQAADPYGDGLSHDWYTLPDF